MSLVTKTTKTVYKIKGQSREYDSPRFALQQYVAKLLDDIRHTDLRVYDDGDYDNALAKIETIEHLCAQAAQGIHELGKLPPEEDTDEDEEWDDAAPSAPSKFDTGED